MLRYGPPLEPGARVLVRLPSWLGDVVACEPALRALCERLQAPDGERLSLCAPRGLLPILDDRFPAARRVDARDVQAWRGHDVAVLFTNSFRSAWNAWRAGIPRRVGWVRDGRGWLLTDGMRPAFERGGRPLGVGRVGKAPRVLPRPFGATCAELVAVLGAEVRDTWPRLAPRAWPERLPLAPDAPYVLVNAGHRPQSAKGVPPELFAAAMRAAAPLGLPFVVVGGPGEEPAVEAVARLAGDCGVPVHPLLDPVADLVELSALAAHARVAWTADAGPLHVLRAYRTPRVVLQGPTDPRHTAEHLEGERRLRVEVDCGPCHLERCALPAPDTHACMTRIDPERVVAATEAFLGLPGLAGATGRSRP